MRGLNSDQERFFQALIETRQADQITVRTDKQVNTEAKNYLYQVKSGKIRPLPTRFKKLNFLMGGGFYWSNINVLAGRSGTGKTAMSSMILRDFCKSKENFIGLIHNMEMTSYQLKLRDLSAVNQTTYHDLHKISDFDDKIDRLQDERLLYIEDPLSVDQMEKLIYYQALINNVHFNVELRDGILKENPFSVSTHSTRGMIYFLDHTILTVKNNLNEEKMLSELMSMQIRVKKRMKIIFIDISQLNREIMSQERINPKNKNPQAKVVQYPVIGDLRGGDVVSYGADNIMITHSPEKLYISSYGPNNWPTKDRIFLHMLKQRFGDIGIIEYENQLHNSTLVEL